MRNGKERAMHAGLAVVASVVLVFALAGCGGIEGVIEKARSYGDTKAGVIKAANCAVSLGGMIRGYSEGERKAAELLCKGSMEK